jgi:hypothetical protein
METKRGSKTSKKKDIIVLFVSGYIKIQVSLKNRFRTGGIESVTFLKSMSGSV